MVIVGVLLIIFGVTLLIVVDAPRRIAAKITRITGRGTDTRRTVSPTAPVVGAVAAVASPPAVSSPALAAPVYRAGPVAVAAPAAVAVSAEVWPAYRSLAPGWYREPTDPSVARYWDGTTLHDEERTVLSRPTPATVDGATGAYRGLPPGWYRDDGEPGSARFWDGSSLGLERRPVAT